MDKPTRNGQLRLSLTFNLPADVSRFLKQEMSQHSYIGDEEFIISALRLMMKKHLPSRGQKQAKTGQKYSTERAPLDAFLPQGADPFVPVGGCHSDDLQFDFHSIQSRMETGRVPKILR